MHITPKWYTLHMLNIQSWSTFKKEIINIFISTLFSNSLFTTQWGFLFFLYMYIIHLNIYHFCNLNSPISMTKNPEMNFVQQAGTEYWCMICCCYIYMTGNKWKEKWGFHFVGVFAEADDDLLMTQWIFISAFELLRR